MSAAQVGERLCFRLSEQEYKGFLRWYKKDFLKEKDLGRVRPDFMNLKEDCCITMENEVIRIQTGNTDIWLLYSALTEVHRKEGLILFFGQKEFWAIPERILGGDLDSGPLYGVQQQPIPNGQVAGGFRPACVAEQGSKVGFDIFGIAQIDRRPSIDLPVQYPERGVISPIVVDVDDAV